MNFPSVVFKTGQSGFSAASYVSWVAVQCVAKLLQRSLQSRPGHIQTRWKRFTVELLEMDLQDFRLEVLPLGWSVGLYLQVPAVERAPCRSINLKSNFEPGCCKQRKVRNRISKSILNVTGSHCGDMSTGLMCLCLSVEPCSRILSLETAGYSGVRRLTLESAIYEKNQILMIMLSWQKQD